MITKRDVSTIRNSMYNVYFTNPENDKNYVFNTWKGNLAEVEQEVYDYLKQKDKVNIDPEKINELILAGFLTETNDEYEEVVKENAAMFNKNQKFSIVIALTSDCNANCSYCFENGIVKMHMSEENINRVSDYIIKNSRGRSTHITWFGGEPLLAPDGISKITNQLKNAHVDFVSTIITNGYYLDKYASKFNNDWNIKSAQITFDGLYEKYDDAKKYNNHTSSAFEKLIQNIHIALKHKIRIVVRINFDASDFDDYKDIIEFMKKEFGNKIRLYFHDIFGQEFTLANTLPNNPHVKILNELSKNGYVKSLRDLKIVRKYKPCSICKPDYMTVGPDGNAVKCEHFIGKENTIFNLGYISNPNFDPSKVFDSTHNECKTCKSFPICSGGCFASWMEKPRGGCLPIKNALEEVLLIYVKEVYKNEVISS